MRTRSALLILGTLSVVTIAGPIAAQDHLGPVHMDTSITLVRGKNVELVRVDDTDDTEVRVVAPGARTTDGRYSSYTWKDGEQTIVRQRFHTLNTCAEAGSTVEARVVVIAAGDTVRLDTWTIHVLEDDPQATHWRVLRGKSALFDRTTADTPMHPVRDTLYLTSATRGGFFAKNHVEAFTLTVLHKGRLVAEFRNEGHVLSPRVRAKLKRYKSGTLLVRELTGTSPCDDKGTFHPPHPLHW